MGIIPEITVDLVTSVLEELERLFGGEVEGTDCLYIHAYKRAGWIKSTQVRIPSVFLNLVHSKELPDPILNDVADVDQDHTMVQVAFEQLRGRMDQKHSPLANATNLVIETIYSVPDIETVYGLVSVKASETTLCILLFQYWQSDWCLWGITSTSNPHSFNADTGSKLAWKNSIDGAWSFLKAKLDKEMQIQQQEYNNDDEEAIDPSDYWGDNSDAGDDQGAEHVTLVEAVPSREPARHEYETSSKVPEKSGTGKIENFGTHMNDQRNFAVANGHLKPFDDVIESLLRATYRDAQLEFGISKEHFRSLVMEKVIKVTND